MYYPTILDYQIAISNQLFPSSDHELTNGVTNRDNLTGLPLFWAGANSVVFRVVTERGALAIKCYLRQIEDLEERYEQFQIYLTDKYAPMFVDFNYESEGILVNNTWYPILKMEWVEGLPLDKKIEELISTRDIRKLDDLSNQWRILIANLQKLHISHGNLSHETVILTDNYIRLIDYDDIFVPGLEGKALHGLWHPNYQHPNHKPTYFNANTGDFSALIIYLSLRALAKDPNLWNKFHHNESLIFLSNDFKSPKESSIFSYLKKSNDTEIRDLTLKLEEYCLTPETPIIFSSLFVKPSSFVKANSIYPWMKNIAKLVTPAFLAGILTTVVSIIVIFGSSVVLLPEISPVYLVFGLIGVISMLVLLAATVLYQRTKSKQQKINSRLKQVENDLFSEVEHNLSSLLN